jgi:RNA polymerase sigma-70 factor (ECF subfamily)
VRPAPGDDSPFDDFFVFEYPRLVAALTFVTGDRDVATDAVDEACARAWEQLRRGNELESLSAWIRVVALNVARGRFRRHVNERRARERLASFADRAADVDATVAVDVQRALAQLTGRQREVVVLHYFLDLSVDDIAAQLRIAAGTVKATLHRARAALAAVLDDTNTEVRDGVS